MDHTRRRWAKKHIPRISCILTVLIILISCSKCMKEPDPASAFKVSIEPKDTLAALILLSKETKKPVLLSFGFRSCAPCQRFRKFYSDSDVKRIIDRNFVFMEIDYDRTPGGKELYKKFGTRGFPSWSILNSDTIVLYNDEGIMPGTVNMKFSTGYPLKPWALDHYLKSIRNSASGITATEIEILAERIQFYSH